MSRRSIAVGLLGLSALLGVLAYTQLRSVNQDPAPVLGEERRSFPLVAKTARRAVLVVIDGLREDVSRELPYLNALRAQGADGAAQAPFPSLSRPGYAALASGVPPWRSGVRNNAFGARRVAVDTIFDRARERGLAVGGGSNLSWWGENFGDRFNDWHYHPGEVSEFERAAREALSAPTQLVLLHAIDCDRIAHEQGVSPAYHRTALQIDAALQRVLSSLDLRRDVVVVTADHGHLLRGGHGGPEPEVRRVPMVLAGFGVKQAKGLEFGDSGGIAPTLAVLLGLQTPRHAEHAMFEAALDRKQLGPEVVAARLAAAAVGQIPDEDASARGPATPMFGLSVLGLSVLGLSVLGLSVLGLSVLGLSVLGLSVLGLSVLGLSVLGLSALAPLAWGFRRGARMGHLALPLALAACLAVLWALGVPPSYSAIVTPLRFALELAAGAAAGALVYAFVLGRLLIRVSSEHRDRAWSFHLTLTGVLCAAAAPLLWLIWGYSYPGRLPPPLWMFLPLPIAFVGGLWSAAAGLALLGLDWRERCCVARSSR